jgi:hypothetical protein
MKLLTTIVCLFNISTLFSQFDRYVKDKNISWAAETQCDFVVDKPYHKLKEQLNSVGLIKLLEKHRKEESDEAYFLLRHILAAIEAKKLPTFRDSYLSEPFDISILNKIDTILRKDATTFEVKTLIVTSKIQESWFKMVRARQIVSYNATNASWSLETLAVAPLIEEEDGSLRPAFWIPVENQKPETLTDDIVWSKRLTTLANNSLKFEKSRNIKTTNIVPIEHFFKQVSENFKIPIYEANGYDDEETKITLDEQKLLPTRIDTITQVNPVTYETRVITIKFDAQDVKKLQLVQEWYWDETRAKLCIHLVAVGPVKTLIDKAGNIVFDRPLFYRKTKDD